MKMKGSMRWKQGLSFECDNHGILTTVDASPEVGGSGDSPTPKELVLNAMMGCAAMDVVSILKKMRQDIESFTMENEVEKTLEHPIHFKSALLTFNLRGNLAPEKVIKAVEGSLTKYCGVNYMISFSCDIRYKIFVNETEVATGKANFGNKELV